MPSGSLFGVFETCLHNGNAGGEESSGVHVCAFQSSKNNLGSESAQDARVYSLRSKPPFIRDGNYMRNP